MKANKRFDLTKDGGRVFRFDLTKDRDRNCDRFDLRKPARSGRKFNLAKD